MGENGVGSWGLYYENDRRLLKTLNRGMTNISGWYEKKRLRWGRMGREVLEGNDGACSEHSGRGRKGHSICIGETLVSQRR